MRIPEPYFCDALQYGNLSMEEILIEDTYPVLFVLKNEDRQRFICVCCDIRDEQRWILNPISIDNLIAFLDNKKTARQLFTDGTAQLVAVRNYATKEEGFTPAYGQLEVKDLPNENVYLDACDDEVAEYRQELIRSKIHDGYSWTDQASKNLSFMTQTYTMTTGICTPQKRRRSTEFKFGKKQIFTQRRLMEVCNYA